MQQNAIQSKPRIENTTNDETAMNQTKANKTVAVSTVLDSEERHVTETRPQEKHIVDRVAERV